eukprot:2960501-Rhodomonas_salina.2
MPSMTRMMMEMVVEAKEQGLVVRMMMASTRAATRTATLALRLTASVSGAGSEGRAAPGAGEDVYAHGSAADRSSNQNRRPGSKSSSSGRNSKPRSPPYHKMTAWGCWSSRKSAAS